METDADFAVLIRNGPEALATADTVVVPASYELGPVLDEGVLTDELAAAFAQVRPGTRMVSICTGSYVLAAAGYLDGRPATTHWASAEHFQRLFPKIKVDADVLYIDDGDVLTSAGVAAGIDLCLHLVRRDHGTAVANEVARRTVVPPHRDGGQAQYIHRPVPESQLATTTKARAWALARLHEPLQLRDLAAQEAMSVRTFTRRFREEAGVSPGQWLTQQRVERATAPAGVQRPVDGPGGARVGLRHGAVDEAAPPGGAGRDPHGLPPHVPRDEHARRRRVSRSARVRTPARPAPPSPAARPPPPSRSPRPGTSP